MSMLRPFFALFKGFQICFFNSQVRRLAVWPWLLGAISYLGSLYGAYMFHPRFMSWLGAVPDGFFQYLKYGFLWIAVTLTLIMVAIAFSVVLVLIFTSAFQSAIARATLVAHGVSIDVSELGTLAEASRTIFTESKKLIILIPLMVLLFVSGLIPFFAPIALLCGACLLAYQFVDVVLDIFHLAIRQRLRFACANWLHLVCFGLVLGLFWAIPFLGILLSPLATAGAAWFLSEPKFLNQINTLRDRSTPASR